MPLPTIYVAITLLFKTNFILDYLVASVTFLISNFSSVSPISAFHFWSYGCGFVSQTKTDLSQSIFFSVIFTSQV